MLVIYELSGNLSGALSTHLLTYLYSLINSTRMEKHIEAIKFAVRNVQKPPVSVTGTWSVPKDILRLFYTNEDTAR
jgi:hypothetical protein